MTTQAPVDRSHPAFRENAAPFYRIVREGLGDAVDGEHFWDTVAEDAVCSSSATCSPASGP